jgi:hypothetical protein
MRGPSPRNHSIYDTLVGLLAIPVWFFVRRDFDKKVAAYGAKEKLKA